MPKAFVILLHTGHGTRHFDLMLEGRRALATWRLDGDPAELREGGALEAVKLDDHRKAYLTYEGPVSRGRGHVTCFDRGMYRVLRRRAGRLRVRLDGNKLSGPYELTRSAPSGEAWTLVRPAGD